MTLAAGSRLGPYEILAPLGAGGMGEVFRARDPRLGREVALKILPEDVSQDRERLARFEGEARTASGLNHPSIVTIYEIGKADSVSYIAMELVQGRTLRELLAEGPMPVRRLLPAAAQIADGLARAHEAGIVHRDLKPENVMVTRDGLAKILDFGLAKLVAPNDPDVSQAATAMDATRPGVILGTVGYMSPEQASGRPLDFRSDQFSFGSILYEMAAGRRAFSRGTAAETLAAVIRDEPEPLRSAVPAAPVALRWLIERCLAKDPEERYAATRDLARDLAHFRDHVSEVSLEAAPAVVPPRRRFLGWAPLAAAVGLGVALVAFALLRVREKPAVQPVRFSVPIPPATTYAPSEVSRGFSVSPDGTRLAIEAYFKGRRRLFVRPLDSEQAVELEGSLDASAHFWSPDSRFIAFYADGKLKKVPATGGPPMDLCEAPFALVGSWSPSGTILFSQLFPSGIYRVPDAGGDAVRVTTPLPGEHHIWPHFLPDGRRFLYLRNPAPGRGERELRVASLDSAERRVVTRLSSRAEYAAPGYLFYVRDSALFAQPFDERKAELRGEPRLLASNVHYFYGPSHAAFSVSQTGSLTYQTAAPPSRLVWFDRAGKELGPLGEPSVVEGVRISPDGGRAAIDVGDPRTGTSDIWVFDIGRRVSTRLHSDPVDEVLPVWSPDGSRLFYSSDRMGPPDIYEIRLGVPGSERLVLQEPVSEEPEDVSPDGRLLAYRKEVQSTARDIWLLPLSGGAARPMPWLRTRFDEVSPRFSPDGRWIAYESNESGDPEIYAALTDGGGEKKRLSPSGGRKPRWRSDGRELFYLARDGFLMSVPVSPGAGLEAGAAVRLFRVDPPAENYDVAPDGLRFLATTPLGNVQESPLRVILNWPAMLESGK